jgi:putative transposase
MRVALEEEYGPVAQQRCWVHKTVNILDKMPKSVQGKAKQLIHEMYLAPTRKAALAAYDQFISSYQIKFPKACECLAKDKEGWTQPDGDRSNIDAPIKEPLVRCDS